MSFFQLVLLLVAFCRILELLYARHNTRRLLAGGASEVGRAHYPIIVLLHAAWFVAMLATIPADTPPRWLWLGLFLALQAGRAWVLLTLGRYWTTRIIAVPGAALVRAGPYRFVRHPNYLVVELEIVALPLAFGAPLLALVFGLANAAVLWWRIKVENEALDSR